MFGRKFEVPPPPTLDRVKREARILLIDDQVWPYETNLLAEGYNVRRLPEPETLSDLVNERYSLVILDVQGVGAGLGAGTNGIDILQYIKSQDPLKPVILYSSGRVPMSGVKGAALADAVLRKSDGFAEFKTHIDNLLVAGATPGRYLAAINARVGPDVIRVPNLTREFLSALNRRDSNRLRVYLESHKFEADVVRDVVAILGLAITLVS